MTPQQLKLSERLAQKENRTMSELVREALRRYEHAQRWEKIREIGAAKAARLGVGEMDVASIVRKFRAEQRERKASRPVRAR
jgi:Arc/MetJ-type ribon-helix-helix transcriptional regulator